MIKNWFFCEAAGMPEIAYKILSNPDPYKGAQPIQSYIQAKIDRRDLTPDELEGLAIELEKQTADSETQNGHKRVGGDPQSAILHDGKVTLSPPQWAGNKNLPDVEKDLGGMNNQKPKFQCNSQKQVALSIGPNHASVRIEGGEATSCTCDLDGVIFTRTTFENDRVTYSGRTVLLFAPSNIVKGSTPDLGADVKVEDPHVHHLECDFSWEAIFVDSQRITPSCGDRHPH
jgi:hypothetical protein